MPNQIGLWIDPPAFSLGQLSPVQRTAPRRRSQGTAARGRELLRRVPCATLRVVPLFD
jgi:hypothetical protein